MSKARDEKPSGGVPHQRSVRIHVQLCSQDLVLPRPDGKDTTQIDHVVGSPFGIFVIETKNHEG